MQPGLASLEQGYQPSSGSKSNSGVACLTDAPALRLKDSTATRRELRSLADLVFPCRSDESGDFEDPCPSSSYHCTRFSTAQQVSLEPSPTLV